MSRKCILLLLLLVCTIGIGQEIPSLYKTKAVKISKDTLYLEKKGINPSFFLITDKKLKPIDTSAYFVDYQKGFFLFKEEKHDTVFVNYLSWPEFLTQEYSIYDESKVVSNEAGLIYKVKNEKPVVKPFDGLTTTGSISRGLTVGNNQNSVVNSNLDLQIVGKLSDKVNIKASIQDSNIPVQEGGYSQKLDEFDQIFVELFHDKWNIRAGDIFLENKKSNFLNFNKKIQGISSSFIFDNEKNKTSVFGSAALVRGKYARSNFVGQEGNQGPYKLKGTNGELFVLIVSGSEKVFVNGILLSRGENNDYTIDYNAGEITFTSLYPVTSEMRISIEYQTSERTFTRFLAYTGVLHEAKKFKISTYLYSENDIKNQPLQQNLSAEQIEILKNSGDNQELMVASSAYLDSYSDNKILYKKTMAGLQEIFEFSNDANEELYNVKFTYLGENKGNYIVVNTNAIGKIYQYVSPIAGVPQGEFEPIITLIAPEKNQIVTVLGSYMPTEKTRIDFETAISNNDKNLYSSFDDDNNRGQAVKINFSQTAFRKEKHELDVFGNFDYVNKNFKTVERLYNIEFNRDWNLKNTFVGNQNLLTAGLVYKNQKSNSIRYQFETLNYSEVFRGNKHLFSSLFKWKKTKLSTIGSVLETNSEETTSKFVRNTSQFTQFFSKNWIDFGFKLEDNVEKEKNTELITGLSQRFYEYSSAIGRGDSTKVYVELGYIRRINDSLRNGFLQKVNTSQMYFLKTQLVKTEKSNLNLYLNYRKLKFTDGIRNDENTINSRIIYSDVFFKDLIAWNSTYESSSGNMAQQEFTFLEVEPGQGVYTWIDYNNNNIQELQEFEIAPFPDQAKYIKIFLPNQVFVKILQNKFSQQINLNGSIWMNEKGFKKVLSYFYNQTSILFERKNIRNNNFEFSPFKDDDNTVGIKNSLLNSLFYNRGKKRHSITFTFNQLENKSLLSIGAQSQKIINYQVHYNHLIAKSWWPQLSFIKGKNDSFVENYSNRDFKIGNIESNIKVGYLFNKNASWDVFYQNKEQKNTIGNNEKLKQMKFGTSFNYNSSNGYVITGEYSFLNNNFKGNANSAVGYQMLQGLLPGKNSIVKIFVQKNITKFLDLSLNYQGRKSEGKSFIHNGIVQLRAFF